LSTHTRGYLFVTMAATLWGIASVAAKYLFASRDVPPFLLTQVRMGLSFVILFACLAVTAPHLLRLRRADLPFFAVWGVFGMAAVQFTYFLAIAETNVATAIFLQYLAPILTALWAWGFEGQRLGGLLISCLLLAMFGSFLLIFGGTAQLLVSPLGLIAGLGAALSLSFYTIYGARGVGQQNPWRLLCYGLGFGLLFWLVIDALLLATGRPVAGAHLLLQADMWPFFAYIAVLATIVPFGLFLTGLRYINPTQATLTGMLEPVVGGLLAFVVLAESLRVAQVLGGGLIVVAVILLQSWRRYQQRAVA
jgi:drug/metabolite transporter (DMT)-like permease